MTLKIDLTRWEIIPCFTRREIPFPEWCEGPPAVARWLCFRAYFHGLTRRERVLGLQADHAADREFKEKIIPVQNN